MKQGCTDLGSRTWSSVTNELSNQVCSLNFYNLVLFQNADHVKQLGQKPCNHCLPCRSGLLRVSYTSKTLCEHQD